ncbi:hypothetical protein [Aquabacterium sp.]|uniref:hypothetical protein n=1 Tax=Aquabacterium sp. TaxID=1872578 RepID=UPI0037834A32
MKPLPSSALLPLAAALLLGACAGHPPPDWQMNAQASLQRMLEAHLSGEQRIEALEYERARSEIARTGRLGLMARAELMRCAARVASLEFEPCSGFEALRTDASEADRAYAAYLAGERLSGAQQALLPEAQRPIAAAAAESADAALQKIEDPLSRLVAAGVLLRSGRATPTVLGSAADTASAQGWRRSLLAWLGAQRQRAEQAGDNVEMQRLQRRIDFLLQPAGR